MQISQIIEKGPSTLKGPFSIHQIVFQKLSSCDANLKQLHCDEPKKKNIYEK